MELVWVIKTQGAGEWVIRLGQVGSGQVKSKKGWGWAQRPVSTARLGPTANEVRHKAQKQNSKPGIMRGKPDVK